MAEERGVGLGTHLGGRGGAVAEVDRAGCVVRLTRLWGAIDAGCAVNPAMGPITRFEAYPEISPIVVQHRDTPSSGAGEEVKAAAIANAFFDAAGVFIRTFPFGASRVLDVLKS